MHLSKLIISMFYFSRVFDIFLLHSINAIVTGLYMLAFFFSLTIQYNVRFFDLFVVIYKFGIFMAFKMRVIGN